MALETPKDDDRIGFDGFLDFCKSGREGTAPDEEALPVSGKSLGNADIKRGQLNSAEPKKESHNSSTLSTSVSWGVGTTSTIPSSHPDIDAVSSKAGVRPSFSEAVSWHQLDNSDKPEDSRPQSRDQNLQDRRSLLRKNSSIADRVHVANSSVEDVGVWGVVVTIGLSLLCVHGLSYVIVEYGMFGGNSEYPFTSPKEPSTDNELSMSDTVPTAKLNDYQFQLFMAFIMYGTVLLTGFGSEYLVWRMFLNGEWDEEKENKWRVAQFLFPILVGTSVGLATQGNFLCLPMLAASMWKLGFPETILLISSALYESEHPIIERLVDLIRGVGNVIHHSSSTLYVTTLLFHVVKPTPDVLSVLPPLLMQHWFVLLKYNYKNSYIIIVSILEVWFEWASFSSLESYHKQHWVGGVICFSMLAAHWCYFGAGFISLIFKRERAEVIATNLDHVHKFQEMKSVRCLHYDPSNDL